MIAVKGVYDEGVIKLLEPAPPIERALIAVVFLDVSPADALLPTYAGGLETMEWGEPMDEEGARMLLAVHQELVPYRAEVDEADLDREKA